MYPLPRIVYVTPATVYVIPTTAYVIPTATYVIPIAVEGSPVIGSKLVGLSLPPTTGAYNQRHLFPYLLGCFLQQLWVIAQVDNKVA